MHSWDLWQTCASPAMPCMPEALGRFFSAWDMNLYGMKNVTLKAETGVGEQERYQGHSSPDTPPDQEEESENENWTE